MNYIYRIKLFGKFLGGYPCKFISFGLVIVLLIATFLNACRSGEPTDTNSTTEVADDIQANQMPVSGGLEMQTFFTDSLGWGFEILKEGKPFIHQPHIPAISGKIGFANEQDAKAVAELMIRKINQNIVPPGVSIRELDSLKIVINR